MVTASRFNPTAFPDSAYAAELQRSSRNLRFTTKLEKEYMRGHLAHSRTLIRIVCVFAALLGISRAVERLSSGNFDAFILSSLAFAISVSLLLAAIAWSRSFERIYMRWAQVLVPVRNSIVAITIAMVAAQGQLDVLTILPLTLIGPFFFLGLRFHTALLIGAVTVLSFTISAAVFDLELPIALRASGFLVMSLVACAIAARHLEHRSRITFLETRFIAELAEHDALTGTKNRRIFDEHLVRLWRQAIKDRCTIAVLLIDIDHFKAYNDATDTRRATKPCGVSRSTCKHSFGGRSTSSHATAAKNLPPSCTGSTWSRRSRWPIEYAAQWKSSISNTPDRGHPPQ